jgi:hypothetical protein
MWIGGDPSGAIGSLPGRLACPKGILRRFSDRPLRHAFFFDALCFDVIVPGLLMVPMEVIGIHFGLKGWIPVKITGCSITGRSCEHKMPFY